MGFEDSLCSNLIENIVCRIGEGFDQNIRLLQIYKYNRSKAKAGSVRCQFPRPRRAGPSSQDQAPTKVNILSFPVEQSRSTSLVQI